MVGTSGVRVREGVSAGDNKGEDDVELGIGGGDGEGWWSSFSSMAPLGVVGGDGEGWQSSFSSMAPLGIVGGDREGRWSLL